MKKIKIPNPMPWKFQLGRNNGRNPRFFYGNILTKSLKAMCKLYKPLHKVWHRSKSLFYLKLVSNSTQKFTYDMSYAYNNILYNQGAGFIFKNKFQRKLLNKSRSNKKFYVKRLVFEPFYWTNIKDTVNCLILGLVGQTVGSGLISR